jgi:hypothetical protein
VVRSRGLEPPRVAPLAPQASASTNSATTACGVSAPWTACAADLTNRLFADKGRAWRPSQCRHAGTVLVSACARRARQRFLHLDRDAVAADDEGALGHRQVVGENADLVRLGGIERDDGAATEAQDLVDRHRGLAQNRRDRSRHFPALPRAPRAILRCRFGPMRYPLTTAWFSGG